jgi:hypothetical protein
MLRQNDWGFAERNVAMTLQKSAPVGGYIPPVTWNPAINPPIPWLFQYSRPSDCLKIRAVKYTPLFVPNFDPQPQVFGEANDNTYTPAQQVILCNVPNALLVYTGQINDPSTWEPEFAGTLADELGKGLAPVLSNLQTAQLVTALAERDKMEAEVEQG